MMAEAVNVWQQVDEYRASQEQGSLLCVKASETERKMYEILLMVSELVGIETLNLTINNICDGE